MINFIKGNDKFQRFIFCFFVWTDELVKRGVTIATSSSTLRGYVTSRAVDENYNQHIVNCSHTSNKCYIEEAWLLIDLRRVYGIKSVKFWYRTDSKYCLIWWLIRLEILTIVNIPCYCYLWGLLENIMQ